MACCQGAALLILLNALAPSQLAPVSALKLRVSNIRATGLGGGGWFSDDTDTYIKAFCGSVAGGKTEVKYNNAAPSFDKEFNFDNCAAGGTFSLELWDKDTLSDDLLGRCNTVVALGSHRAISCSLSAKIKLYFDYDLASQLPYLRVHNIRAYGLSTGMFGADAYVKVWCDSAGGDKTEVQKNNPNPSFNKVFLFSDCVKGKSTLRLQLWDSNFPSADELLGSCSKPVEYDSRSESCSLDRKMELFFSYNIQ